MPTCPISEGTIPSSKLLTTMATFFDLDQIVAWKKARLLAKEI